MTLFHLFLVAILQGITEFLPVSSSGHLVLLPYLTGMKDQGQILDVAVHVGTLFAVVLYFRKDVNLFMSGFPRLLTGKIDTPGSRLLFLLIIATVPVVAAGLFLKLTGLVELLRSVKVIGWTLVIFGLALYWADQKGPITKSKTDWSVKDAVILGLLQAIALIPGTSRSGIAITGARALGYNRIDSAKIAMLMSIPTIIASGTLLGAEIAIKADLETARYGAIAAIFSFVAATFALSLMMRLLNSVSYTPYVIYRVILGLGILWVAYS